MAHPVEIPALLLRRLTRARRNHAIAWAKSQAAQFPGIMFTAIVGDTMFSYESDQDGRPRRVGNP